MKNTIKLGIIAICLSFCISCAHHKPAATPKEVNDYLSDMCHSEYKEIKVKFQ